MTDPVESAADTTPVDKLLPYRALFGKPVCVQVTMQFPYMTVVPKVDPNTGVPLLVQMPDETVMGVPDLRPEPENYLVGKLRASECGTLLVIEQLTRIERSGNYSGGQGRMDIYLRPEVVMYVTIVKSIESTPPRQ